MRLNAVKKFECYISPKASYYIVLIQRSTEKRRFYGNAQLPFFNESVLLRKYMSDKMLHRDGNPNYPSAQASVSQS